MEEGEKDNKGGSVEWIEAILLLPGFSSDSVLTADKPCKRDMYPRSQDDLPESLVYSRLSSGRCPSS